MHAPIQDYQVLAQKISGWLRQYAEDSGMIGFVVGVSGGIDSAVVSTLCAHTGLPTRLLMMPISTRPEDPALLRARAHCDWLMREYGTVTTRTLTGLMDVFNLMKGYGALGGHIPSTSRRERLADANSKSRLRMLLLYHEAQLLNSLVVGTGNKVEDHGVFFYTKYGDGGVDLSPIADLLKSEVYRLGETLGVSEAIRSAAPTDGLWEEGYTDEDQLGASYDELEWAMLHRSVSPDLAPAVSERQQEVLEIYDKFARRGRHKSLPIPVFVTESLRGTLEGV